MQRKKKILPMVLAYIQIKYGKKRSDLIDYFNSKQNFIILTASRLSHWIQGNRNDPLSKKEYLDIIIEYILKLSSDHQELANQIRGAYYNHHGGFYHFVKENDHYYQSGNYSLYIETLLRIETHQFNDQIRISPELEPASSKIERTTEPKFSEGSLFSKYLGLVKRITSFPKPYLIIIGGLSVIIVGISIYLICLPQLPVNQPVFEAENYSHASDIVRIEPNPKASNQQCIHFGPDEEDESKGIGDQIEYSVSLPKDLTPGIFEIWYADDRGGNLINVYIDNKIKGSFRTGATGGWDSFQLDPQKINLGKIKRGSHIVKLEMVKGGSWGVLLDSFKVITIRPESIATRAYRYVKSLINPKTGLVQSSCYEPNFTTLKKNALAAIAFTHQRDLKSAEAIFNFYQSKYKPGSFNGFNKDWEPKTGAEGAFDHWVGDNALLLIALNYYKNVTGSYKNYQPTVNGLVLWLAKNWRQEILVGEAYLFAALKPFAKSDPGIDSILQELKSDFQSRMKQEIILDHIALNALCFSDVSGFQFVDQFKCAETWSYNGTNRRLMALFSYDEYISVEPTLQIFLAWKIWRSRVKVNLSYLETELKQLVLFSGPTPGMVTNGLPYFVSEKADGWPRSCDEPLIDTTCYLLFCEWGFNPFDF